MTSLRSWVVAAIAAGALSLAPRDASAWVAVGPRPVGFVAVGVAAGAVAGAAMASAAYAPPPPTTVVVTPPPPAPPPPAPAAPPAPGTIVAQLPAGCVAISGGARYQCGSVFYQPYFGSNGVYYQVVPPPPPP